MKQATKVGEENSDSLEALERFVVENDGLLQLESHIGRFNIFDALGITRVEIRHSNFLAFILDPAESHGQGQLFLKAVLMDLLKRAAPAIRPLSPIELDGTDLRGIEIKREWKNIDLLITCQEPPFVVAIENKVDSHDHSNQLNRYSNIVKRLFPRLKPLYVYLTPDGDEPFQETEEAWLPYKYADIHGVLSRVRDTYQSSIGRDVLAFLDHYLNLLGTRFMNDEKLDELCRKIYQNHRRALEIILERVGSPESRTLAEVVNTLEKETRWSVVHRSNTYVHFIPQAWKEWLMPHAQDSYPFCVHIRSRKADVVYNMRVGPIEDTAKRSEILKKLREKVREAGFKEIKAKKLDGREGWNRISATDTIVNWGEDDELEPAVIQEAVKKLLDDIFPKLEKLAPVLKNARDNLQGM